MKRHDFRWTIVAMTTLMLSVSSFAVPVTDDEAATAAASLVAAGGAMDAQMGGGVSEVRALTPPDGASPFRVVKFADGGFIVTSGDTEDDPFVFISDGPGDVVEDDENPLWGILRQNMSANEAARSASTTAKSKGVRLLSASTAENKWAKWLPGGNGGARLLAAAVPATSISDICVPRIMDIRWNQRGSGIASHYYNDAIPHHCAVGCVAVAMAQVIRHYRWPATIGAVTKTCTAWNGKHGDESREEDVELTTSGFTYDWYAMPAAPDLYVKPPGQTEISRFLYDVGITVKMNWHAPDDDTSEDGGSGSTTIREAFYALHDVWGYTNVVWNHHGAVVPDNDPPNVDDEAVIQKVKDIYLPCLAAGMPVIASISGHEVVADGYGYSDETLYFHINYGWGGTNSSSAVTKNTGWYVATLPIQGHETGLSSSIYNISTNAVGSLFSGRVFGRNGRPVANAEVYAIGADGVWHTATANAAGVYVFNLPPGSYNVYAAIDGETDNKEVVTQQNKSAGLQPGLGTVGNVSGVDLHIGADTSFVWTGGGDGRRFGDVRNWNRGSVPPNGSTVVFHPTSGDLTLNNDLAGFGPANILFLPSQYGCTITNKYMNGVGSIVSGSSATNTFKVAVAFAGDIDVGGLVAFTDGGSATGTKPVAHANIIGLYNLTAPNWTPGEGVTIHTNSVVNVPSMMLTAWSGLDIEAGGTLNVAGDVLLTHRSVTSASIARKNDGQINVYGCIASTNAHAYPCEYGNGRIYAREIVNNSGGVYEFNLFTRSDNSDNVVSWEIGEGGLRWGRSAAVSSLVGDVFNAWGKSSKALEIKARSDFIVAGKIYLGANTRLDTAGHTITLATLVDGGSGPLTLTGGGTVKMVYDTWSITNWTSTFTAAIPRSRLYVDSGTTLSLDSGSYLTRGTNTVSAGATLVLPMTNPGFGATLGSLHMEGGSLLVVSNFTGEGAALALTGAFRRFGDGPVSVRVMGSAPGSGRTVLATGFRGADVSDFSLERTGVAGPNTVLEVVNGTLYIGTPLGDYVWNGSKSAWGDAGAWTRDGAPATWEDMNNVVFSVPGSEASLAADVAAAKVRFTADATVVGESVLDAKQVSVSQGVVATIDAPLGPELEKTGPGTLAITHGRVEEKTILAEGTLKFMFGDDALNDTVAKIEWGADPAKKVAIDCSGHQLGRVMTYWLRSNIDVTLTNGTFGAGYHDLEFSEAKLPAVLTIAKDAVVSNIQHRVNINDGSTHVINIAGGKMYSTKNSGGNHWLMQASASGRLDINVTDGGLLEFWYELYALTCRDGEGYVDPSLHITMRDSTFRITNNKSFRFGWDGNNKNAVSPVGVFAATNSVFEGYGFFLGNDVVTNHTAGSYTADFEGCIVSARQFRVFHDRPLNAVRFSNTRLVLTESDTKWLTAADEFNSVWHVNPITVGEGGLVMDSNGKSGSLVANLQGQGKVTKAGAGTLTVSRNQTGTGPFVCQRGTTFVEPGLTVTRPIAVKDVATLKVDGTTKVSLDGLALDSGAVLSIKGGTATAAPMSVTALTLPAVGTATLRNDGGSFAAGTYAVLEMPGITAEQVYGRLVPRIGSTFDYAYTVENGVLKLVVALSEYTYVPAVAPTCEQPGSIAYLKTATGNCYDVDTRIPLSWDNISLAPLGHDWGAWTVVTPASFVTPGEEERFCTRSGCGAHETQEIPMLRHSTFTVTPSGSSSFIVTRSETNAAECVLYRTVGLSAYAAQHFTEKTNVLSFAVGELSKTVTVSTKTPSADAYKFQTGTSRVYRLELTDEGGFQIENAYADKSMTTGTSVPSSGAFNKKDLNATSSSEITITDSGYASNPGKIVNASSFFNATAPKDWFVQIGAELRTTMDFKVREKENGYQYVQILKDETSNCDDRSNCSDGDPGNISLSRYMAGFDHEPGKKNGNYALYSFPVTNMTNNCSATANVWNNGVANKLYTQKFNTGCRAGDGRLIFPPNVTNFIMRFNASGGGTDHDEWCVTNVVMHVQAVDGNRPTKLTLSVAPGRHARGCNVYVSVAFSEIVKTTGTPYLETTWGRLNYIAGSGSNVLTFSGTIEDDATLPLSVSSISGTIKDLAGNRFTGSVTANEICALDASYAYPITYKLSGGNVDAPNPATYTYDDATFTLVNPTREGYQFDGWSGTDIEGLTNEVVIARHSHGTREYAAHWTATPPPQYPPYLDGAADEVLSNYDDWAAKYGYDPNGEHEAAFLLDVAPEAITNGVTPLVITELGTTNVVVAGSIYELIFQEVALAFGPEFVPESLPCRRIVLASGAGALKPGPWREYNGMGGYGMDICNGYVVLRFGTDLSQPKARWQYMSWFVDFEGDHAVVTIPEMFLENARRLIEDTTGRAASGLFLSVGIVTKMALDEDSIFLIMGSSSSQ